MLNISDLSLRRGPRLLFEKASFALHAGWKVGLTGGNGTGKSSLFAMIRGEIGPDVGEASVPSGWVIAHVAQETPAVNRAAIEYVLDGDKELRQIEAELEQAEAQEDGHRLGDLHGQFAAAGGYEARSRAARLMHGLGFRDERPVKAYSGGWRMRLNLARALMCRSDLLLLDEPTNHLDLDAVIWLEDWLRAYPGTLILISHDRDFLDAVVGQVLHIERGGVTLYRGNYSAFERQRAQRLARQGAAGEKQRREIEHMRGFVERFRAKATKARQARSRLKALERLEEIAPAHVDSPFHFEFPELAHLPIRCCNWRRSARATALTAYSRARPSPCGPGSAWVCWATTAPASPPSSRCWPGSWRRGPDSAAKPGICASAILPSTSWSNSIPKPVPCGI